MIVNFSLRAPGLRQSRAAAMHAARMRGTACRIVADIKRSMLHPWLRHGMPRHSKLFTGKQCQYEVW